MPVLTVVVARSFGLSSRRDLLLFLQLQLLVLPSTTQKTIVISTEATHSFIVSCAVERPPHFAVAFVV